MHTLQEIKAGLKPGATAYWGARCCWWTTNPEDLGELPVQGEAGAGGGLPCCPYCGSPLMMGPAEDFIATAEGNPGHYPGGIETFVRAYHGNGEHARTWTDFQAAPPVRFPRQHRERSTEKSIRCTACGTEFSEADTAGRNACPACGHKGLPMRIADDVEIRINWHELRILGIWADNWAGVCDQNDPTSEAKIAVGAILRRLQAQHPDRPPLTLLGDLQQVQETFPDVEATGFLGEKLLERKKPS